MHNHDIGEPTKTDFYRSPEAETVLMQPTLLVLPSVRDLLSDDLCQEIDTSARVGGTTYRLLYRALGQARSRRRSWPRC